MFALDDWTQIAVAQSSRDAICGKTGGCSNRRSNRISFKTYFKFYDLGYGGGEGFDYFKFKNAKCTLSQILRFGNEINDGNANTAVKRLRMRELSGEEVEEHQLMMMTVHRYRWSLIAVILHLLAYYIIFIVSNAVFVFSGPSFRL